MFTHAELENILSRNSQTLKMIFKKKKKEFIFISFYDIYTDKNWRENNGMRDYLTDKKDIFEKILFFGIN